MGGRYNRVNIDGPFNEHVDPSRYGGFKMFIYLCSFFSLFQQHFNENEGFFC